MLSHTKPFDQIQPYLLSKLFTEVGRARLHFWPPPMVLFLTALFIFDRMDCLWREDEEVSDQLHGLGVKDQCHKYLI